MNPALKLSRVTRSGLCLDSVELISFDFEVVLSRDSGCSSGKRRNEVKSFVGYF